MRAMQVQTIHIGADHGGFELKQELIPWLESQGCAVFDHGADALDPNDDYPTFAFAVAEAVVAAPESIGILVCRSGGGMAIAANKVAGARAVVVTDERAVRHALEHNDANILVLSGDWLVSSELARELLKIALLHTTTLEPRHQRRLGQIALYEQQHAVA